MERNINFVFNGKETGEDCLDVIEIYGFTFDLNDLSDKKMVSLLLSFENADATICKNSSKSLICAAALAVVIEQEKPLTKLQQKRIRKLLGAIRRPSCHDPAKISLVQRISSPENGSDVMIFIQKYISEKGEVYQRYVNESERAAIQVMLAQPSFFIC